MYIVRYFASGTDATDLVGAFLWLELRNRCQDSSWGLFCALQYPLFLNVIAYYYFIFSCQASSQLGDNRKDSEYKTSPTAGYTPLPTLPTGNDEDDEDVIASKIPAVQLTERDKWRLVKPMLLKYMLPLCE